MSVRVPRSADRVVTSVWRLLVRLTIIGLAIFACYLLQTIIATVLVAAVIAYVLAPVVEWLCWKPWFVSVHTALARPLAVRRHPLERHTLRTCATIYVFIAAALVAWEGTVLVLSPFVKEISAITAVDKVTHRPQLAVLADKAVQSYNSLEIVPDAMKTDKLLGSAQIAGMADGLKRIAGEFGLRVLDSLKNIIEIVLLPVLAFYFLIDGRELKHEFVALVPRRHMWETSRMLTEFNRIMRAFIVGQVILCLLAGVVVGLGLTALHVKYPVTLAALAGVTRAIPIIGPIVGGIPIILLTWITKGAPTALLVLGFFTLLHLVESKFIMPMLIGDRMDLHPVVIILVLLVGGVFGGLLISGPVGTLLGMFFAAPIASLVRVLVRRYWLRLPRRPLPRSPLPAGIELSASTLVDSAD